MKYIVLSGVLAFIVDRMYRLALITVNPSCDVSTQTNDADFPERETLKYFKDVIED